MTILGPRGLATSNSHYQGSGAETTDRLRDEAVICAGFNGWFGPLQALDTAEKERELGERKALLQALCRLYEIGNRYAGGTRRILRPSDAKNVFALFRRLFVLWKIRPDELADFSEAQAASADGISAHAADPLQVRSILSCHREMPPESVHALDLSRLKTACTLGDYAGIQAWFNEIAQRRQELPRELPQILRHVLFQLWKAGVGDLEGVAFELAVLEVRLFGEIGWENSRLFYSLLNRLGGSASPAFGAYVTPDDITDALEAHQALGDAVQGEYFRSVLAAHDASLLGTLRRYVFEHAEQRESESNKLPEEAPVPSGPVPRSEPAAKARKRSWNPFKSRQSMTAA